MHQRQELPGIQRFAFRLQPGLQRVGEREVDVVAAEQDVFADADALQIQIAADIGHGDQAEIRRATPDVANQDDVARRHQLTPFPPRLRCPRVEGGLRFFQQNDAAKSRCLCRFGRQVSRDLVEGRGNRHHHLAIRDVPLAAPRVHRIQERVFQMLQIPA